MKLLLQKLSVTAILLPLASLTHAAEPGHKPPSAGPSPAQAEAAQEAKFAAEAAARAAVEAAASVQALPPDVRATLPMGATSLYLGQFPMSSGGRPLRVHVWAAGRKSSPWTPHQFDPSPFCVDLFELAAKNDFEPGQWHRVAATVYLAQDGPRPGRNDVTVRWLQPAQQQGLVVVIVSPCYITMRHTVITFPRGVSASGESPNYVQDFYESHNGYHFGVDKRGIMTVLATGSYQGSPVTTTVYSWNGREYVPNPPRPERR